MKILLVFVTIATNIVYAFTCCRIFGLKPTIKKIGIFAFLASIGICLRVLIFPYTSTLGYLFFIAWMYGSACVAFYQLKKIPLLNCVITLNFFLIAVRSLCISSASVITNINPLEMVGDHPLFYFNTNLSTGLLCIIFTLLIKFGKKEYFELIGEKLSGFNMATIIIITANIYMILCTQAYQYILYFKWYNWYQLLTAAVWIFIVILSLIILLNTAKMQREKNSLEKDMIYKHNSIAQIVLISEINCTKQTIEYINANEKLEGLIAHPKTVNDLFLSVINLLDELDREKIQDFDMLKFFSTQVKKGNSEIKFVYRILFNKEYRWMTFFITLRVEPISKDILAVFSIADNVHELKETEQLLKDKSEKDSLLNIYNKESTEVIIKKALKEEKKGVLFLIDIDNFKEINDTFGHLYGDDVLKDVTEKITNNFRPSDIIGRIGGDEFLVFLNGSSTQEIVRKKAIALNKLLKIDYEKEGQTVGISASIGIALYPSHGKNFQDLYVHADTAMYDIKVTKKNGYAFYNTEMKQTPALHIEHYLTDFEKLPFGIMVCKNDEFSTILSANNTALGFLDCTRQQLEQDYQDKFTDFICDDNTENWRKVEAISNGNGEVLDIIFRIKTATGSIKWIHDIAKYDSSSNLFYVTMFDISDKIAAQLPVLYND